MKQPVYLILAILLELLATPAWPAIREVGPGQTYTTIGACITAASATDTCNVHAGTYAETVVINRSLILQANVGDTPIISGAISVSADNVTIDGFEVTNFGSSTAGVIGINGGFGRSGITIINNTVHDGYGYGISTRNSTVTLINGNQVYNLLNASSGVGGSGIVINSSKSTDATFPNGTTISNNVIHDNATDGMDIHGQYFTIFANNVYNNITTDWASTHPDGIQILESEVDGLDSVQHARIYNNIFRNHTQNIFIECNTAPVIDNCEDIEVYGNLTYNDPGTINGVDMLAINAKNVGISGCGSGNGGIKVYGNTFGDVGGTSVVLSSGAAGCLVFKNNLLQSPNAASILLAVSAMFSSGGLDFNSYYAPSAGGNFLKWDTTFYSTITAFNTAVPAQEANGEDSQESFADISIGNFYLTAATTAGNTTICTTSPYDSDYDGSTRDSMTCSRGAFEYFDPVSITSSSPLTNGDQNMAYSNTLTWTGGSDLITCSIASGAMPAEFTLNASTCEISGTTASYGTHYFTVDITDIQGQSDSMAFSLTVDPAAPVSSKPAKLGPGLVN